MKGKSPTQSLSFQTFLGSLQLRLFSNHMIMELFNTVAVRFIILIINFTATTLITRALSVEDRGKYAILLSLINVLMTIFTFGFHAAIVYKLSNNIKLFTSLYSVAFSISASAILFTSVFLFFGNSIYPLFEIDYSSSIILIIGCPIVLFSYFTSFFFLGVNKFQKYNFFEFTKSFIFLLLVLLFAFLCNDYTTYICLFICSSLIHFIGSFFFFLKNGYLKAKKFNIRELCNVFKNNFRYSMMSYFSCILALILNRYNLFVLDGMLATEVMRKEILGYYSVALNNIDIISILPATLAFFIFPKISAAEDMKTKIKISTQMIMACILFFVFIGIISFTMLEFIFDILYGSIYREAVHMFQLLLPSALFLSIISCISSYIGGIGNEKTMIYAPLAGLFCMIPSSFFLLHMHLDVYYFILFQNISYFLYLIIYISFFIKKWRAL